MRLSALLNLKRGKNLFLPAHGRGNALPRDIKKLLKSKPGSWDLPELPDIGGPTCLGGAVSLSQKESALAIGADRGWYGVNGATGLLQSALLAMSKPKQSILMPRNVHKSIIQACILGDIRPVLFDLPYLEDRGHFLPTDIFWFKKIFECISNESIELSAVVLTNPTYQGYSADLHPLVQLIHKKGLPVLVDEAHGTHFSTSVDLLLPKSSLRAGADLVVHSLHKSALGLGQTAALWLQGDLVDPEILEKNIACLQTTSPSALLLASCEAALNQWQTPSGLNKLANTLTSAREISLKLRDLGLPLLENQDPLRIILHTASRGISGLDADSWFLNRGLIGELPEPGTITFCLGFSKHRGLSQVIKRNWDRLLSSNIPKNCFPPFKKPKFPLITSPQISCLSAFKADSEMVPLSEAVGRISSNLISPYPPGVPILVPGELLDQNRVNWMMEHRFFWPDQIPSKIMVIK
ncbi:aminotransferase class I/II-fold pyridoxal phosphate-dependent enzyme [Prochlorococcus marinus]|uniref:aminotransferase class I/II-fold pyridoxal phosphate-dependent enzyme n=1 Tax=Prochlorococcus marinus TaxID=1219 RepID=UPI0022B34E1C|nr:aminotransferase class I/II-fold pyridoxal phosphate-dependent enzyme [Prochlorococcus marinus]